MGYENQVVLKEVLLFVIEWWGERMMVLHYLAHKLLTGS